MDNEVRISVFDKRPMCSPIQWCDVIGDHEIWRDRCGPGCALGSYHAHKYRAAYEQ